MSNYISNKLNIPEILAPAGTVEAMKAAVNAGCDAVYLGGDLFSARAFAGNFDTEELVRTLNYCHLFGVKVYMTVNTLLRDDELEKLPIYMEPFYRAGLDGVIVQDVGVVRTLHRAFPKLHLHGSTQMSISSSYGAKFLKNLGITRVVPARELSLEEIKSIREKVDIEIESFVHGAMCYAYSGKCLLSSFLGGRSGNRGRCAQPCRQIYSVSVPGSNRVLAKEYAMSLKDMCTLTVLPQLIDAGIASFKIEGRMKNPFYVAATVDAYKKARDFYLEMNSSWENLSKKDQDRYLAFAGKLVENMQDIYNRGGFHTGYYFTSKGMEMTANKRPNHTGLKIGTVASVKGPDVVIKTVQDVNQQDVLEIVPTQIELTSNKEAKRGRDVVLKGKELKKIKPGMEVFRTRNNTLLQKIDEEIIKSEKQIEANAIIFAKTNEPLSIQIYDDKGNCVSANGNMVEAASNKPTDGLQLVSKMQKTGGTNVSIQAECVLDDNSFVPMSEFNNLRREAIDKYKEAVMSSFHRTDI